MEMYRYRYFYKKFRLTIKSTKHLSNTMFNYIQNKYIAKSKNANLLEKILKRNNSYILLKNHFFLGLFMLLNKENHIHLYFYIYDNLSKYDLIRLNSFLNKLTRKYDFNYIEISNLPDSKNLLNNFSNFDLVYRMELNSKNPELENKIGNKNNILKNFDKEEQIRLHNLSYHDDKEYMLSNWAKLIDYFQEKNLEKIVFTYKINGKIIGSCLGWIKNGYKYLFSICVLPEYRNKGIAKILLDNFIMENPDLPIYLTVFKSNRKAIGLYEKYGFKIKTITNIYCTKLMLKK